MDEDVPTLGPQYTLSQAATTVLALLVPQIDFLQSFLVHYAIRLAAVQMRRIIFLGGDGLLSGSAEVPPVT